MWRQHTSAERAKQCKLCTLHIRTYLQWPGHAQTQGCREKRVRRSWRRGGANPAKSLRPSNNVRGEPLGRRNTGQHRANGASSGVTRRGGRNADGDECHTAKHGLAGKRTNSRRITGLESGRFQLACPPPARPRPLAAALPRDSSVLCAVQLNGREGVAQLLRVLVSPRATGAGPGRHRRWQDWYAGERRSPCAMMSPQALLWGMGAVCASVTCRGRCRCVAALVRKVTTGRVGACEPTTETSVASLKHKGLVFKFWVRTCCCAR